MVTLWLLVLWTQHTGHFLSTPSFAGPFHSRMACELVRMALIEDSSRVRADSKCIEYKDVRP